MKEFTLTIPGKPHHCERPIPLGRGMMQDTHANRRAKKFIAKCVMGRVEELGGFEPFGGAVIAHVNLYFKKPPYKIRKNSTPFPFMDCQPDYDNLVKITLDGIQRANGIKGKETDTIIWSDDGQVLGGPPLKHWCVEGEEPRTEVKLVEVKCPCLFNLYCDMLDEAYDVLKGGIA